MKKNYLQILAQNHPQVLAFDNTYAGNVYETLQLSSWSQPLPPKTQLDAEILADTRRNMWLAIQEERTRRQYSGIYIPSVDKWFHTDTSSRIQHIGLTIMGANMPNNIQWKTMDGSFVLMTPQVAQAIFAGLGTLDMTVFAIAEQHRANMLARPDPENYDFSGSWPPIFGE